MAENDLLCRLVIPGKPQQRGSKNAIPIKDGQGGYRRNNRGGIVTRAVDSNKHSKVWMKQAAMIASAVYHQDPYEGSVKLEAVFAFQRPKSHYKGAKRDNELKAASPADHVYKPDLAKLVRCAEDALTGIIYKDDSQICCYGNIHKIWTEAEPYTELSIYKF